MQPFVGLSKALSQWEWVRTVLNNREAQDLFVLSLLPCRRAMGDDAKACACVVKCLFRGGDAACFRAAIAWRRNIFYGKT